MKNVFCTKINKSYFISEEDSEKIDVSENFDYNNYFFVKKKYFNQNFENSLGIRSLICFIDEKYDESFFWKKYNLNKEIYDQVSAIQYFHRIESEDYSLIPSSLTNDFGIEYLKLIKFLYRDYEKYFKEVDIRALRTFDATKIALKRLTFNSPFLSLKKNIDSYKNYIYQIGKYKFLKVHYSNEKFSNGLIMSYDRSINNIASNDEIRKSFSSRFQDEGTMLQFDYNAFQPRIIFSLAGYDVNFEDDFYDQLLKKLKIKSLDRNKLKEQIFKLIYGGFNTLDELRKHYPKIAKIADDLYFEYQENREIISFTGRRKKFSGDDENTKVFNSFIQMAHSDVISEMIVKLDNFLLQKKSKFIGFITDSFLLDVYNAEFEEILDFCKNNLQKSSYFDNCFLKLNFFKGQSWKSLQKID